MLRPESVAPLLRAGSAALAPRFKLVHGIYSASVLLSGDWLRAPAVGERLDVSPSIR